ncbi:hypothetical protein TorRG33x02_117530 [Trema orientale]|uniref:Uncharacterized protein n=1 Tax=Trema orientale TaxID=63057 RepID=A0A2P5F3V7_TREOI|nr:hypothetical protein TorRG33x02_117530 [Trema orientale]
MIGEACTQCEVNASWFYGVKRRRRSEPGRRSHLQDGVVWCFGVGGQKCKSSWVGMRWSSRTRSLVRSCHVAPALRCTTVTCKLLWTVVLI